jgi:transcriptional regulator with XRE-family HTH domain
MPAQNEHDARMERLAALMRDWRDANGVRQADAAVLAGVDTATWGALERGDDPDRHPSPRTMRGIASVIGLTAVEAMQLVGRAPTLADVAHDGVVVMDDVLERLEEITARVRQLRDGAADWADGPDDRPLFPPPADD